MRPLVPRGLRMREVIFRRDEESGMLRPAWTRRPPRRDGFSRVADCSGLPPPNEVRRMIEVLDRSEKPVLVHCQRGADRTGLVSTSAVLLYTTATLGEARRQLWPRYGHIRGGRTTIIDQFFDLYESWLG